MDNKIFNVNGRTQDQLLATLKLALLSQYNRDGKLNYQTITSWEVDPKKGFILFWGGDKGNKFPVPMDAEKLAPIIFEWLHSDDAQNIELTGKDSNYDHDGHNKLGFRVYCEDWGRIDDKTYSVVAITPAWCWYGK